MGVLATSTGFRRVTALPNISKEKSLKLLGPSQGFVWWLEEGQFILKELAKNCKLCKELGDKHMILGDLGSINLKGVEDMRLRQGKIIILTEQVSLERSGKGVCIRARYLIKPIFIGYMCPFRGLKTV